MITTAGKAVAVKAKPVKAILVSFLLLSPMVRILEKHNLYGYHLRL